LNRLLRLDVHPTLRKRSFQQTLKCWSVALALVVNACGGATAVTGNFPVGSAYNVQLQKTWSTISLFNLNKEVKYLTIDGPLLNNFYLTEGLSVGRSIVRTTLKSRPMPVVKSAMSENEMVEFVVDTVAAFGYEGVTSKDLRPTKFGSADAIRFDIAAKTDSGLDIAGTAQVALVANKVHVMLFLAPGEYFYPTLLSEVDSVFGSASLRTAN
jgi:hypothetical protein